MKAVVLHDFESGPAVSELPTPQTGANELLVRVQASSVNPADAAIAAGMLKGMAEYAFPVTLGRDFAGVVETVGSGVSRYQPGDRVYGFLVHANPTVHDGSWADYLVVPEDTSVARKPDSVDVGMAGAAPLAAVTALAYQIPNARLAKPKSGATRANAPCILGRVSVQPNPLETSDIETAVQIAKRPSATSATAWSAIDASSRTPTPALPPAPCARPTTYACHGVRTPCAWRAPPCSCTCT